MAASTLASRSAASRRARVRGCNASTTGSSIPISSFDELRQAPRFVDGAGAVRRREHVLAGAHAGLLQRPVVGGGARREHARDVDHDVTDDLDGARHRLAREVARRDLRRREQQRAQMVGDDAVDLLGHRAIEGAHPRLDVGDRNLRLGRREGAGEGRVRVAVDEHRVGRLVAQQLARARRACAPSARCSCRRRAAAPRRAAGRRAPGRRSPTARRRSAGRCARAAPRARRAVARTPPPP